MLHCQFLGGFFLHRWVWWGLQWLKESCHVLFSATVNSPFVWSMVHCDHVWMIPNKLLVTADLWFSYTLSINLSACKVYLYIFIWWILHYITLVSYLLHPLHCCFLFFLKLLKVFSKTFQINKRAYLGTSWWRISNKRCFYTFVSMCVCLLVCLYSAQGVIEKEQTTAGYHMIHIPYRHFFFNLQRGHFHARSGLCTY